MKVRIAAVGRLRAGAEADLIADYRTRFERTGKAFSLGPLELRDVEAKKGGQNEEAKLLLNASESCDLRIALDERGVVMTSPDFARNLADWRDNGLREIGFLIGGASGLTDQVRQEAQVKLSFGKMVWPHMLARVMLVEQLYRASAILAGTPYHKS